MALDGNQKAIGIVCLSVSLWYAYHIWMHDDVRKVVTGRFYVPSLEFVAVMFRHGERAPVFKCKNFPTSNDFPEGSGELTKIGKQHMYKKGQIFRNLYNGFLSNLYTKDEILTKTTRSGRSFMSAAMVLAGLYPPIDYQKWSDHETVWTPIPIYSESPDHGLLFSQRGKCPAFDNVTRKIQSELIDTKKNSNLLLYLSENCGKKIDSISIFSLYDLFLCQIAEGLKLPEWTKPNYFQQIKSILYDEKNLQTINGNPSFQKFTIGPLLKEIGLEMESRSTNLNNSSSTKTKMHLYSGHDISIAMTMGFLGNIIELPDFGASLHFHLYNDEQNGYTIKLFYYLRWDDEEGKDILLPECSNPCKVQDFINIVNKFFPGQWEEECQTAITDS